MPKPELSNKKKWNNSDEFYLAIWNENDTNFKNMMRGVRGRLLHIVASEEYRNNMEENEVDDDNKKRIITERLSQGSWPMYQN